MRPRKLIGAILVVFCSTTFANDVYKFDQAKSTIRFCVHQFLGTTHGKFDEFYGKSEVGREHPENAAVTARIDVRSVDTGRVKRDHHWHSAECVHVEKSP